MEQPSSQEIELVPADQPQQQTILQIPPVSPPQPADQPQQQTIVQIPPVSPPRINSPLLDLLDGPREDYMRIGVPLYEAAIKGDWKAAKLILDTHPLVIRCAITENHETLLHVAASAECTKSVENFVRNLVNMMTREDLELQNRNQDTALMLAAAVGNVKTARIMVQKNPALTEILGRNNTKPLYLAALFAKPEMVRYLYDISKNMSGDYWSHDNQGWVLRKCVEAEIFDVAIKIVDDNPILFRERRLLTEILIPLSQKTQAFKEKKPHIIFRIIKSSIFTIKKSILAVIRVKVMPDEKETEALQLLRRLREILVNKPKSEIDGILRGPPLMEGDYIRGHPSRILFLATKMGNTRFVVELIRLYPDLIWTKDDKGKTIFHLAIECRHSEIYNLLYEIGAMRELITPIIDTEGKHMVANKANNKKSQNMSGAALEMQRELLWYKEVEQMIPPQYRHQKNNDGKTPQDLFTEKHDDLVSKGESWMNNYMLVATLIATVVFAAAFTLPGGYNQTGVPNFRKKAPLIIFVISDAVSLISSSASVLIFLSILTSRYVEHDFMDFLPSRIMFGIATLFLSIVTMMVAFSASFFLLYHNKQKWVPIIIASFAGVPVIPFAQMQLKLLADAYHFTYRSRHLFNPKKRILYK